MVLGMWHSDWREHAIEMAKSTKIIVQREKMELEQQGAVNKTAF
jgi:hypothetical protein